MASMNSRVPVTGTVKSPAMSACTPSSSSTGSAPPPSSSSPLPRISPNTSGPTIFKEPKSVQFAQWPEVTRPVDQTILDSAVYMRGTIKTMRDAELSLLKKMNKGKQGQATYDPKRPRAVRIYVSTAFPEWQETCVQIVKDAYSAEHDKVDDQKVRELLTQRGLIKDKRAMPFVQAFKVRSFICALVVLGIDGILYRNVCSSLARKPRSTEQCRSRR